jgi:hypothetical protein
VVDLLRLTGVDIHGGSPVRVRATVAVTLTGTTNTVRTVFFTLTHGPGAGTILYGVPISLNNDLAATSMSESVELDFIILNPPAAATDEFALRWSTGANATANVNGSVAGQGGGVLNVEELSSASGSIGPTADTIFFDSKVATEPTGLLTAFGVSFANALDIDPDIQIVDISVRGGGAGNVYMLDVIYRLPQLVEDVVYPRLADQLLAIGFGAEPLSMVFSSTRWLTDFPAAILNFWDEACSGDGAQWVSVYMFEPGEVPPGPGLLAVRDAAPSSPSRFVLDVGKIEPVRGALSQRVAGGREAPAQRGVASGGSVPSLKEFIAAGYEPSSYDRFVSEFASGSTKASRVVASDTIRAAPQKPVPATKQRFEASPRKKGN